MHVVKVTTDPPSIVLADAPSNDWAHYKSLCLLMALMPPSNKRIRAAAKKLGVIPLEVAINVGAAIKYGEKLLVAWPDDVPLEGEKEQAK